MIPILFEIGPIKIYSFGLMVMFAFLAGGWMTTKELNRRRLEPNHLEGYPMLAVLGGLLGAKLYYLIAHWGAFTADPLGYLFEGSGLTWYGGVLGGALAVLVFARMKRQSMWSMCDAFAPGLAAAYGVGRIGCQLSGDGDYGPPSDLPWAMAYPKGIVPTQIAVHPTPVYEILMMAPIIWILWRMRARPAQPGWLFGLFLVLASAERWISELFRVRPDKTMGMSTAQWISVALILAGFALLYLRRQKSTEAAHAP